MEKNRGTYFSQEAKFWSWFSSNLRKVWNVHPTKLDYVKSVRFTKHVNFRPIYHVKCASCKQDFPLKEIEVNHKVNCGNIKEEGYALRMMDVGFEGLECLCKPCHAVVTYAERSGMTLEDAKIEKRVIAFLSKSAKDQKEILMKFSYSPKEVANEKLRRELCRLLIKKRESK